MAGRLFAALALGRADGRYPKMLRALSSADLLILDDWGPESLNADQRRDLLEIVEDRYNRGSVLITTQVPIGRWYEIIGNPTLADAILDRSSTTPIYDGWLQGIQAVVQRQQRVPPEGGNDRLLLDHQHGRLWILRPWTQTLSRGPLLPLDPGLRVDPVPRRKGPQALLAMLYRSTDRRYRCGSSREEPVR